MSHEISIKSLPSKGLIKSFENIKAGDVVVMGRRYAMELDRTILEMQDNEVKSCAAKLNLEVRITLNIDELKTRFSFHEKTI